MADHSSILGFIWCEESRLMLNFKSLKRGVDLSVFPERERTTMLENCKEAYPNATMIAFCYGGNWSMSIKNIIKNEYGVSQENHNNRRSFRLPANITKQDILELIKREIKSGHCRDYLNISTTDIDLGAKERINAQGSELRSIPEIRKEPSDIKSGVKETERERRLLRQQTAGGPPPTLSSSNEEVAQAIGGAAISRLDTFDTLDNFTNAYFTDPINDYFPVSCQEPPTTTFLPHTSTFNFPPTATMKSKSFTTTCKGKSETTKDPIHDYFSEPYQEPPKTTYLPHTATSNLPPTDKDETIKITNILNQHTELLHRILEEQRRTNRILQDL